GAPLMLFGCAQTPALAYPGHWAVAARALGYREVMPPFIAVGRPPLDGGYLGAQYNAFTVPGDPGAPDFRVQDLRPPAGVSAAGLKRREKLLGLVDAEVKAFENADGQRSMTEFYRRAYAI